MLDLNRATDKKIELHLVEANLSICVIQPVLAMLSTRETDFEVQMDCPVDLAIVTDILRLKQVLLNLVRNSAKFVEKGFIRIKAEVVDGRVLILVQDSGPGIPADKRNKLFNKFQESLDLHFQGTGIGLSLCKSLVETMAGRIWLDEHYDSGIPGCPGTSFVIQTNQEPIEETSTDQESLEVNRMDSRVPQEESEPVGQTPEMQVDLPEEFSVLFVDDDNVLRKLFARAVKKVAPSWHIAEAVSGEVAIQLARTNHFDLILCDQYMTSSVHKSLLGTETARELRAQGYRNRICGLSANDLEEAFLKAGADCFLIKPFPCKADEIRLALAKLVAIKHEELAADQ
jgi:CheY-like chemotaxis protein